MTDPEPPPSTMVHRRLLFRIGLAANATISAALPFSLVKPHSYVWETTGAIYILLAIAAMVVMLHYVLAVRRQKKQP